VYKSSKLSIASIFNLDREPVASGLGESDPGRKVKKIGQHQFIQLQIRQITFTFQCTQTDFICCQILGEPENNSQQQL